MTYTIDIRTHEDGWLYFIYTRGGSDMLTQGTAENLESALSEASRQVLVNYRSGAHD